MKKTLIPSLCVAAAACAMAADQPDIVLTLIENVTSEGFKYNEGVVYPTGQEIQGADRWKFARRIPGSEKLAKMGAMKDYKAKIRGNKEK